MTMGDMIAEIESDTERSDADAIRSKINAAIRHYQPKRFFFNEGRSVTFNTAASTAFYSKADVGAEFYTIDGAFLTVASTDVRELDRTDYAEEEAAADEADAGVPSAYAYIGGSLRLIPAPDDTYSVRVAGHQKLAAPASDTESGNAWMDEAYDLIMSRAKAELYAHRWEDSGNAQLMAVAERDALGVLLGATHAKVSTGRLEATEF